MPGLGIDLEDAGLYQQDLKHEEHRYRQGAQRVSHESGQPFGEPAVRVLLEIEEQRRQEQHIGKYVPQEPQVAHVRVIIQGLVVVSLEDVHVQGRDGDDPEQEGQQDPDGPLADQLLPVTLAQRKIDSHARDVEQERDAPNVEQGHRLPQVCDQLLAADEADEHGPGLEDDGDVIDKEQADRDHTEPVDVVSSFCFHDSMD